MRWTLLLPLLAWLTSCATTPETPVTTTTSLVGTAENAKGGAVLLVEGVPVYIEGLDAWLDALLHTKVKATGVRTRKQVLPEATVDATGAVSQGAVGL
jgi:hypothetical protein